MAGGSDWVLQRVSDKTTTRQKVEGGPWFMQKGVEVTISRTFDGKDISTTGGEVGATSAIIVYTVARTIKTRSLSNGKKFVCTSDEVVNSEPVGVKCQRVQTWLYVDPAETEINNG